MSIFSKFFGKQKKTDKVNYEESNTLFPQDEIEKNSSISSNYVPIPPSSYSQNLSEVEDHETTERNVLEKGSLHLYQALRYIASEMRVGLDETDRVINILTDFHAFKDENKLKYILRYILNNCFTELNSSQDSWSLTASRISHKIIGETGFQPDIVNYIVSCIGYGLSLTETIPDQNLSANEAISDSATTEKGEPLTEESSDITTQYIMPTIWDNSEDEALVAISCLKPVIEKEKFLVIPFSNDSEVDEYVIRPGDNILIAGSQQTGKSTLIHQIITSLLYSHNPSDIQFILMDEYGMELNKYNSLANQFLASCVDGDNVIVENSLSCLNTLSSLLFEANKRLTLIKEAGAKDWFSYITKLRNGEIATNDGNRDFPYIVVIIDEISSFLGAFRSDIEFKLSRLSQLSTKVGISIIVSTNQVLGYYLTPSFRNIFNIKMLFKNTNPSSGRLFGVPYRTISALDVGEFIISDRIGASPVTVSLIPDDSVNDLVKIISSQNISQHPYYIANHIDGNWIGKSPLEKTAEPNNFGDVDPLFEDSARAVVISGLGSTSSLQRRFSIGYNRAGKIMDQLEAHGIVGSSQGVNPRQVLVDIVELESILGALH